MYSSKYTGITLNIDKANEGKQKTFSAMFRMHLESLICKLKQTVNDFITNNFLLFTTPINTFNFIFNNNSNHILFDA